MPCQKSIKVVIMSMFVITTLLFSALPAFAKSSSNTNVSLPGSLDPQQCLTVAAQSQVTGPQTFNVAVQATNACGFTFDVTTRINTQVTDCSPFPTTSNPVTVQLNDQQTAAITPGYSASCVDCEDGVPIAFPPFHVRVTAFAFGTVLTPVGIFPANSNFAAAVPDIQLSNFPPPVVPPPCP